MIKFLFLIAVLILNYGCERGTVGLPQEITLIVTANVHGQLDPCG